MQNPDAFLEHLDQDAAGRVFAAPYQTPDGVTVVPTARVSGVGADATTKPLGVFVIHNGKATWVPVVDTNRIAVLGVLTGLLSAVIASLAVLRRPPWPDLSVHGNSVRPRPR
jgi:hypothetical protein